MSITSALNNSVTGLNAASKSAEIISSNVANALTEGYGKREVILSARSLGGAGAGVQIDAIQRNVDQLVLHDRRQAEAGFAYADSRASFLSKMTELVGVPVDATSLNGYISRFEVSLIEAGSRPDLAARLEGVSFAASQLVGKINSAADGIQTARQNADLEINALVQNLNSSLAQLERLNADIVSLSGRGRDISALLDRRQTVVDRISSIVPVQTLERDNGRIALLTNGGVLLIDHAAPTVEFSVTPIITPDMSIQSGGLSGLSIDGSAIQTQSTLSPIAGGSLAAAFETRDELAVQAQMDLDAFARDLIERFEEPGLDPTLTVGSASVFTDNGAPLDAMDTVGLANRLGLNALLDLDQGGDATRWRDGLGATGPGDVGNAAQLNSFASALSDSRAPIDTTITATSRSASGLAEELASLFSRREVSAEATSAFAQSQLQSLEELEASGGVNTDEELQRLLLIEQAYAANARVIQVVDDLLELLMGL